MTKGDVFKMRVSHSDGKIWWKCSDADFTRLWVSLTCWLSKEFLKQCFLKSGLTKCFTVWNFRNKVAMMIIFFFPKCLKFDVDSRNGIRKSEEVSGFKDNSIWIGDYKFPKSWTWYLSLPVNVLRNTPRI